MEVVLERRLIIIAHRTCIFYFFFWLGVALTGQISAPLYPNATSGTESLDTQVIILEP
jgi:hypothetical protein